MTERDFIYWLNGHVELNPDQTQPTPAQWKMIKEHLALVMTKVTPPMDDNKLTLRPGYTPSPAIPLGPFSPSTPWWDPLNPNRITCQVDGITYDMKSMTFC